MDSEKTALEQAESKIDEGLRACVESSYDPGSRRRLRSIFEYWTGTPECMADGGLRIQILNRLTATLVNEDFRPDAWAILSELAEKYHEDRHEEIARDLVISTFELFAEAPEVDYTLELLFSLASRPGTRWAVFAAYERFPWRLRPHARKFSKGSVTDDDCDQWLVGEGFGSDLYLMDRRAYPAEG